MYIGEITALLVAISWTISALFFEKSGKSIGLFSLNLIRLIIAFVLLGITLIFTKQSFIPSDASFNQWFWLGLSGIFGLFVGDLLLYKSYVLIGSRTATLIMSSVPVITTIIGWFFLKEILELKNIIAILVCMSGIFVAIADRKMKLRVPLKGILYAFGGAVGQSIGLVFSKKGMGNYDPIASTQIRIIFAIICFVIIISILKKWPNVKSALKNRKGLTDVTIGSVFGAYIGITLSLFAIQNTQAGIASTFMSLVPVFIIIPSAIMFKEKITTHSVVGAIISLIGVSIFFL